MNIEKIIKEIQRGNLVITPTDTVYGILADATNIEAIEKVYAAKRRPHTKPLILLMSDMEMVQEYTSEISGEEQRLMEKYWPGKVTILLQRNEKIPAATVNGGMRVGIRIPDNTELLEVIRKVGRPLVSTSANISDHTTATNIAELEPELLNKISYVEDAGIIEASPSTLVKVEGGEIVVLRAGAVKVDL